MHDKSSELLQRIRARLRATARRMTLAEFLFGCVLTAGAVAGLWLVATLIEAGWRLDVTPRSVLLQAVGWTSLGLLTWFLIRPLLMLSGLLRDRPLHVVAREIGQRMPRIGDRLVNLLDLSEGRHSAAPPPLLDEAMHMLGADVEAVPFETVADFSKAKRSLRFAAIPVILLLGFLAAAPGTFTGASARLLSPGAHFDRPVPFQLHVTPGDIEIAKGSTLTIEARTTGQERPDVLEIAIRRDTEDHIETLRLREDSSGVFRHEIENVRRPLRYRVTAGPVASAWRRVSVIDYPLVRSLRITLRPPAYAGLPAQELDPDMGDVAGLPGTRVDLDLALGGSKTVRAAIAFDDGASAPLEIRDGRAAGAFTITRKGAYRILLENARGAHNHDPIEYTISVEEDSAPSILLTRPEPDALLDETLQRTLEGSIRDDFGFHDLALFYRLSESRFGEPSDTFAKIPLPLPDPRLPDQRLTYDWLIGETTSLDPVPGDVIEYFVRVRDNDAWAGYKAAQTAPRFLRTPSLAERYESLREEQEGVESRLLDILDQAEQLDEQFDELRDEVRNKQRADWEDQRQLGQIEQQQQRMEEQVNDLVQQVESMNRTAERNNLLSDETLSLYQELQEVVEEIDSPEFREAMAQLQEAIAELDLAQVQEAIEQFEFSETQYRQRLERTLELFKNLRAQQSLEEAARRAEELARQQERMEEETARLQQEDPKGAENQANPENPEDPADPADPADEAQAPSEQDPETSAGDAEDETGTPQDPSEQERLAQRQESAVEEMQQLEELMNEAQQRIQEMQQGPARDMQQLNRSMQEQNMPQQLMENADQLRSNQLDEAQDGQQRMQQWFRRLRNDLNALQSSMQGAQRQINLAGLRRALGDVLTLSQEQETLRKNLLEHVSNQPSLREEARLQDALSAGFATVIDSLRNLEKNIPQLSREVQRLSGQALMEMEQATSAMTDRAVAEAGGRQTASMMHLNELALLLANVLDQLMNQQGSGGGNSMQQVMQQMQQMAQQQQQLNQQIQQFLNDMQGNRLGSNMEQRLQQMRAQQQAIRDQLGQVRRNPEARGKLLGDLDKIADDMEETLRELETRRVAPQTIERQRQILQRLLDAQRSMQERGRERRRESREGQDAPRNVPPDALPEDPADTLHRDLIRALESGYAPDFEERIRRYFEILQREEQAP